MTIFRKRWAGACDQFTVRKAFKSNPPTYDHAWYSYSTERIGSLEDGVNRIAEEIRGYQAVGIDPWPTNWDSCFKFGINYACPHFEQGCSKMKWDIPADAVRRVSHLEIERRLNEGKEGHGMRVSSTRDQEGYEAHMKDVRYPRRHPRQNMAHLPGTISPGIC